ncbi:MAG: RDD family protein [Bdellovibrionaceae bacterium]|nr:RDD family protein [Pseudobdellovibrionaceae bacterium]
MNQFDDFEFKPITEGLGFHKREKKTNSHATQTESDVLLSTPLPRTDLGNSNTNLNLKRENGVPSAVEEILNTLKQRRPLEFEERTINTKPSQNYSSQEIGFSVGALLLDSLLILAGGLLALIIVMMATRVDVVGLLANPALAGETLLLAGGVFFFFAFVYYTLFRVFLGQTPGEWAHDLEMDESSRGAGALALRTVLVFGTGILPLPLIGAITGRDLAGRIVGRRLTSRD